MSAIMEDGLRQRIPHQREDQAQSQPDYPTRDPVVLGKTPSGQGVHITDFRLLTLTRVSFSFSCPDHARCHHGALPPVLSEIAH